MSGSEDEGKVTGKLVMVQRFPESGGGVLITGRIDGLRAGRHGFHVHMKGELGNACKDAGGHFNPYEVKAESKTMWPRVASIRVVLLKFI